MCPGGTKLWTRLDLPSAKKKSDLNLITSQFMTYQRTGWEYNQQNPNCRKFLEKKWMVSSMVNCKEYKELGGEPIGWKRLKRNCPSLYGASLDINSKNNTVKKL